MRDAPSIDIANALIKSGAQVRACDPIAIEHCLQENPGLALEYYQEPYSMAEGLDALVLVTEWQEYTNLDMQKIIDLMAGDLFVDGRNQYSPAKLSELGFTYVGMGRNAD
jgi:UDPglucose 6-dehydrogenase